MKILNIIQRYPPAVGGSETWCQEVCRYLAGRGHAVTVLTMDVNKEEEFWREPLDEDRTLAMGKLTIDRGVVVRRYKRSLPIFTVHHGLYKRVLDAFFNVPFYGPHSWEMYAKMRREVTSADLVLLHTLPYPHNLIGYYYARKFGKKVVIVPHFHPGHPHYERPSNYWLLRKCDRVIAVSDFEKEYLASHGIAPGKIAVTGNALHPEDYCPIHIEEFRQSLAAQHGLAPEDRVITFIGRKLPEKGVGHLIDAVRRLRKQMPLKLFLVGPSFEWFKSLYAGLTAGERRCMIDLGVLPHQEKVNLLHLTDLFVLPSKFEAFGIVFLEAWICSVPVLGSRRGAMPSVIGNDGFLTEYGSVDDLERTIRLAFSDTAKLRALGANGKGKVLQQYTWSTIGAKVMQALISA